jgi:hypothetical protein
MKSACKKWRAFKCYLKNTFWKAELSVNQNVANGCGQRIHGAQWRALCKIWRKSSSMVSNPYYVLVLSTLTFSFRHFLVIVKMWCACLANKDFIQVLTSKNRNTRLNQANCLHTAGTRSFAVVHDQEVYLNAWLYTMISFAESF